MDELTRAAQAARRGDRRALERLVTAAYPDVRRLCAALVDEAAADDLAQDTFVRATRALRSFRGQSTARTWILAIARRVCMDALRARYRRARRDVRLATVDTAQTAPDPAAGLELQDLLRHLSPERRAAFVLTQLLTLSYEDAAQVCACPTGTIRSRVARARADLVEMLDADQARRPPAQRPGLNRSEPST
jgi:RNA polymerase sigma-70 factor (ECF subfamily)